MRRVALIAALTVALIATPAAAHADPLAGLDTIQPARDSDSRGQAEAFLVTAASSGQFDTLGAYLDPTSTARRVQFGLYTNASTGKPGTRIASCEIAPPAAGWNTCTTTGTVIAGTRYWLAILEPSGASGTLQFRDAGSTGTAYGSSSTTLTALPASFSPGTRWPGSPVSAYVDGTSSPTPSPTATPSPSPTATPSPSPTATPSPTSTPTATPSPTATPAPDPSGCDINSTPSTFTADVANATAGQTLCLASGNYGAFTGTTKAITIKAADGAEPQMTLALGGGAAGFTLDGMTGMTGSINGPAHDVTIRDSTFTSSLDIAGTTGAGLANIVIDGNTFAFSVGGFGNGKIMVNETATPTTGASPGASVTIENNYIANGQLDGVHMGGAGVLVQGNHFENLCDVGQNHTDNLQFEGGTRDAILRNYVHAAQDCPTQGITSYDGGTGGLLIADNVVDVPRDWGIELYADQGSVLRHNTVVWHPASYSEFGTGTGQIDIDAAASKGQHCGGGTVVEDNIATGFGPCQVTADHNVSGQTATYVGGLAPPSWALFALALDSPVGVGAGSDGLDAGIRTP